MRLKPAPHLSCDTDEILYPDFQWSGFSYYKNNAHFSIGNVVSHYSWFSFMFCFFFPACLGSLMEKKGSRINVWLKSIIFMYNSIYRMQKIRPVVLNLWVLILWTWMTLSRGSHIKYPIFTLQFIIVEKLQLGSSNKRILWLGSPEYEKLLLKGPSIR